MTLLLCIFLHHDLENVGKWQNKIQIFEMFKILDSQHVNGQKDIGPLPSVRRLPLRVRYLRHSFVHISLPRFVFAKEIRARRTRRQESIRQFLKKSKSLQGVSFSTPEILLLGQVAQMITFVLGIRAEV